MFSSSISDAAISAPADDCERAVTHDPPPSFEKAMPLADWEQYWTAFAEEPAYAC
jgi:hypothetical protein